MKKHNFSAGPSILPKEVIEGAAKAVIELDNIGLSLIEISHRSKEFIAIMEEACQRALQVLNLENKGYKAMFLHGGASLQFLMAAYNLLENKAGYVNTGTWSTKAIKEAKLFGEVTELASSKEDNFNYIPKGYDIPTGLDYVHLTTNNTIFGTQFKEIPTTDASLVADMSSDIFSREFEYSKFDLFYAGAQKNIGPAGLTIVIVREDLIGNVVSGQPKLFDYSTQANNESMFNTPATFPWYVAGRVFEWLKEQGGLSAIQKINQTKAQTLYKAIDTSDFYSNPVSIKYRSWMNVPFLLADDSLNGLFLERAKEVDLLALKGHRSVGGMRASIYNAMPQEGVDALVNFMNDFEKDFG